MQTKRTIATGLLSLAITVASAAVVAKNDNYDADCPHELRHTAHPRRRLGQPRLRYGYVSPRTTPAFWRATCSRPPARSRAGSAPARTTRTSFGSRLPDGELGSARVAAWARLDADTRELLTGYADGYNRYLRDTAATGSPRIVAKALGAPARGARRAQGAAQAAGARRHRAVSCTRFAAAPPALPLPGRRRRPRPLLAGRLRERCGAPDRSGRSAGLQPGAFRQQRRRPRQRSHGRRRRAARQPAFPLGRHRALLCGAPHDPGALRRDGWLDFRFPLVNIGFNSDVAWSHTVSTARRFILRELALVPGNPRAYRLRRPVEMQPEVVAVDVLQPDGSMARDEHTFWQTQFGPVVVPRRLSPGTPSSAYALTDVNLENDRGFQPVRRDGAARDLGELGRALERHVGLPWVNTIAADAAATRSTATSARPQRQQRETRQCSNSPFALALPRCAFTRSTARPRQMRSGHRRRCARAGRVRRGQPAGPDATRFRAELQRQLLAGESGRAAGGLLAHHRQRRENPAGFPHATRPAADLRSRCRRRRPAAGFDRRWLQGVLFGNRHYSAEIMLPGVLQLCATKSRMSPSASRP